MSYWTARRWQACWVVAAALTLMAGPARAQPPTDPAPAPASAVEPDAPASDPFGGLLHERAKLTGDWHGARTHLFEHGLTLDLSTTQFYQGVAAGGLDRAFVYGGRNDYFLTLDGEKAGLWPGLFVNLHGETRYGRSANLLTGALSPVNEYLNVPGDRGTVWGLTGAKVTQHLSEDMQVYAGKINLLDDLRQPLTGATGLSGFLNLSLIFNPIFARTLPYSAFGAGLVYEPDGGPVFTLAVYDATDASATSVFDNFFTNGAVIFGTAMLPTEFFGFAGHHAVEVAYSTGRYTNFQKSPYLDPVGDLVFPAAPKRGSWAVAYHVDQALWEAADDPDRVWGVFGRIGLADDNPNPIRWTAAAGVAGASPLPGREGDTFGVGYYYLGVSDVLRRSARPLTPLGAEHGVEAYYNARVTPWCHITPDVQVIAPFERPVDTVLVLGVRARVDF